MSERALGLFFERLADARERFFPDLFFRGHRSGNPLVISLPDEPCRHLRFRLPEQCLHLERIELFGGSSMSSQELAQLAQISSSSVYPGTESLIDQRRIFSSEPQSIGVHTQATKDEWLCLSFPQEQAVTMVRVHNRDDEWAWRAWSLVIETSVDGMQWTEVYSHAARQNALVETLRQAMRHAQLTLDESQLLSRCTDILAALNGGNHALAMSLLAQPGMSQWQASIRRGFNSHWLNDWGKWWSGHGITRPFRYWSAAETKTYVERALLLLADLRKLAPECCFGFGFVLAYVRDGRMIPHDDDLDLLVAFDRATTPTISAALARVETHLRTLGYEVRGEHFNHRWVFKSGWNAVDVFVGLRENDRVSWFPSARKSLAVTDVFPAVEVDLFDLTCPVPRNPIRYLDCTYGQRWREPDVDFKHPWDRNQFADIA
jgi:hypothetical protein